MEQKSYHFSDRQRKFWFRQNWIVGIFAGIITVGALHIAELPAWAEIIVQVLCIVYGVMLHKIVVCNVMDEADARISEAYFQGIQEAEAEKRDGSERR